MNRSHHKGKNGDSDFNDGCSRLCLQDEPNEEENNLTTSMMFIAMYNLIINLLSSLFAVLHDRLVVVEGTYSIKDKEIRYEYYPAKI